MYRSIAYGGGGARGVIHAGAYRAIQEVHPSMSFPDGIYGSSVGGLYAIATAYNLPADVVDRIAIHRLSIDSLVDRVTLDDLQSLVDNRGLVTTEALVRSVNDAFLNEAGIDLRGKTCDDLPQKVFFLTSNLTTGRACLLTGKVPVLKAVACSACLPLIFRPEVLNGHVFQDGAVYSRSVQMAVPKGTFCVSIGDVPFRITPTEGSLWEVLYTALRGDERSHHQGKDYLHIRNTTIGLMDTASVEVKEAGIKDAYSQTRSFLAKRLPEKLKEAV